MYPNPEQILKLLKSVKIEIPSSQAEIVKEEEILKHIKINHDSLFIIDDWFESHFKLTLNYTTLNTFYTLIKKITYDFSYHKGIEIKVLQTALLKFCDKMQQALEIEMTIRITQKTYNETMGLVESSLKQLKANIETMHKDTTPPYVVHLPHSGVSIPDIFGEDYLLGIEELKDNVYQYADYQTDSLYGFLMTRWKFQSVQNPYSRLFMDPERFFDDTQESMQVKHGLGWFYENTILGKKPLRTTQNKAAIAEYYHEHHDRLECLVEQKLNSYNTCTIIDCHSFSNERYWFHDKSIELPDICIGYDEFHKDEKLVETIKEVFKEYKVTINSPYAGSLVPTKYYMKDKRVKSVMIEINKKLYLEADNITPSKEFSLISSKLSDIGEIISKNFS